MKLWQVRLTEAFELAKGPHHINTVFIAIGDTPEQALERVKTGPIKPNGAVSWTVKEIEEGWVTS